MEPVLIVGLIVTVVLVILIVAALVSRKIEKQRTEQLRQMAGAMGFEFEPAGDGLAKTLLSGLPLFSRGHSKKTRNVLRKIVRGSEVILLDHQYTVGSGKNQQTHKHTVALFSPGERKTFPDFELSPESFWHRIGAMFGYQDIDFESHPKFSKKYLLRGSDETAIRAGFTPDVLDFFEKHPDLWSVEARANWIAVYGKGRAEPSAMREFLMDATKVYLLFVPQSHTGDA